MCHEYQGGYTSPEAASDGVAGSDCPPDDMLWKFNHWAYVDVFVYASRHRVAIPPVGYIHAAHRHGALVLGTVRFDADSVDEVGKIINAYPTRAKAAQQLATIAKFFGFDGWLVRIDAVPEQSASSDLAGFIADLTRSCRQKLGPASEVIWFDSITSNGEARPQNELNEENDVFFKAAGSLFTSFQWSRNAPVRSAVKAGPRRTDIFTGIDVHGRKTFGGGGFQTHIALRAIKQAGTSAAIFAPSWTVEKCPSACDPLEVEERFWTGPRGRFGRECVAQYFKERAVLTQLPFSTSFDPGWGPRTVSAGNVVSEERYFNMKRQDVQPSFLRTKAASGDGAAATLAMSHEQALNGSASVRFTFSFSESRMLSGTYSVLRLLVANVTFPKPQRSATHGYGGAESLRIGYQFLVDDSQNQMRSSSSLNRMRSGRDHLDDEFGDAFDPNAAAREAGANQFGLLLLFAAPMRAVLLVGENSRWYSGGDEGMQRSAARLEILGKYVEYTAIAPSVEEGVRGAPKRMDGSPSWVSRSFDIPPRLLWGQRLQEVMVIVGEPPLQPISVRPSPLVTPRSHSRVSSFRASRLGSGRQSPMDQGQYGLSKSTSYRSSINPRTKLGAELLSAGMLREDDGGSLRPSRSYRERDSNGLSARRYGGSRIPSGMSEEDPHDNSSEYGSDASDTHSQKSAQSYRSYTSRTSKAVVGAGGAGVSTASAKYRSQRSGGMDMRSTTMDELDYAANFDIAGSVDFSHMQADVINQSASRAISRLGSRLGTPDGGRFAASYGSRSRITSRNPSRMMSPAGTPSGSTISRTYSARGMGMTDLFSKNNSHLARSDSLRSVGGSMGSMGALSELKMSLMNAADSMATGQGREGATGGRRATRGGGGRGMQRIFLGGLALEMVDGGTLITQRRY